MDYKVQTTVFAVIFILVGMMFVGPVITQKALANIAAEAYTIGKFSTFKFLDAGIHGRFMEAPILGGDRVKWSAQPPTFDKPTEAHVDGFVKYEVVGYGPVSFYFYNSGYNPDTCRVSVDPPALRGDCIITHIPRTNDATATFNVYKK